MHMQRSQEHLEILAQMGIRKGSRVGPLLLLLLVALLFIVLSFPGGIQQLAANLQIDASKIAHLNRDDQRAFVLLDLSAKGTEILAKDWDFLVRKIGLPLAKSFLEDLVLDSWTIAKDVLHATWQIILYSLIPGLAGLIYRKNFWSWFLVSFAVLLAINASGIFGTLADRGGPPKSEEVLLF